MPPAPREPRLGLVETCWRLVGPSRRVVDCGICPTDLGFEVRAGYGEADLLHSQFAVEIGTARDLAMHWCQALIDKGSFTELPLTEWPRKDGPKHGEVHDEAKNRVDGAARSSDATA